MGMSAATRVPLGHDQHVLAHRVKLLIAERADVRCGLQVLRGANRPPAELIGPIIHQHSASPSMGVSPTATVRHGPRLHSAPCPRRSPLPHAGQSSPPASGSERKQRSGREVEMNSVRLSRSCASDLTRASVRAQTRARSNRPLVRSPRFHNGSPTSFRGGSTLTSNRREPAVSSWFAESPTGRRRTSFLCLASTRSLATSSASSGTAETAASKSRPVSLSPRKSRVTKGALSAQV